MLILAFESSCDETSAAVVDMTDEHRLILSDRIASQIEIHKLYGGVVPEIAGRAHCEAISGLAYGALEDAKCTMDDIDAVAVTNHPGLIGALLVGVSFAKSLAWSYNKPLIAVQHIRGHVAANYLVHEDLKPPFLALVVSGGHTSIIDVRGYTDFVTIGRTRDDAAGEAFDKVGRKIGLPYPGGAEFDRLSYLGNKEALKLPSAAIAGDTLDVSFSGLKTFVINYLNTAAQKGESVSREDIAASFTNVVVKSLRNRVEKANKSLGYDKIVLAGGVAANSHLRASLAEYCENNSLKFYCPPNSLCGDNGAMIGAQAYYEFMAGNIADVSLNAYCTQR